MLNSAFWSKCLHCYNLFYSFHEDLKSERCLKVNIKKSKWKFVLHDCVSQKLDVLVIYRWVVDHKSSGLQWCLFCSGVCNLGWAKWGSLISAPLGVSWSSSKAGIELSKDSRTHISGIKMMMAVSWEPSWSCQLITHGWLLSVASVYSQPAAGFQGERPEKGSQK